MSELYIDLVIVGTITLFLGGFIKGAIGFGMPLIVTPLLLFYLPLPSIVSLIVFPVLVSNLYQCWVSRASVGVLREVWPMITMNAFVLLVGSQLIISMNGNMIRGIIGGLIIFHVFMMDRPLGRFLPASRVHVWSGVSGAISGMIGSLSSFYSFPSVQLLHSMRLSPEAFVFAVGLLMVTGFIALWCGIAAHGVDVLNNSIYSLLAVFPVVVGVWAGNRVRKRYGQDGFRMLVSGMLVLTGISLVVRSIL